MIPDTRMESADDNQHRSGKKLDVYSRHSSLGLVLEKFVGRVIKCWDMKEDKPKGRLSLMPRKPWLIIRST